MINETPVVAMEGVEEEEVDAELKAAELEEQQQVPVITRTPYLPQAYDMPHNKIYVRYCHDFYYEEIMKKVNEFERNKTLPDESIYISLTGTPGIGKSAFYQDFFQRYRAANPAHTVLTASFNKKGELKKCRIFHPDGRIQELEKLPNPKPGEKKCEIYLFDGAPGGEPSECTAVIFTSPKGTWFEQMSKYENHVKIHFLNWTFEELKQANTVLELGIDEATLWKRYLTFGGAARYILTKNTSYVNQGFKELVKGLKKVQSYDQLKQCFDDQLPMKLVVHRLMSYVPNDPTKLDDASLVFASKRISIMVYDHLQNMLQPERNKLMAWLDGVGQAAPFQAHIFESFVHERFLKGGDFTIRLLGSPPTTEALKIAETVGTYGRFRPKEEPLEQGFFQDVYRIPASKIQESIDSYYLTDKCLYMFQVTRNAQHGVKADGLVDLLKQLEKLQAAKEGKIHLKLIFVVPSGMENSYPKQEIEIDWVLFDKSEEEINQLPCDRVPSIKEKSATILKTHGINTIGDLLAANITSFKYIKQKLIETIENRKEYEFLKGINQYVLGMSPEQDETG